MKVKVAQLHPTLCNPVDWVHGLLQARTLEWVAFPFSRGSPQPRDRTQVSHTAGDSLLPEPPEVSLYIKDPGERNGNTEDIFHHVWTEAQHSHGTNMTESIAQQNPPGRCPGHCAFAITWGQGWREELGQGAASQPHQRWCDFCLQQILLRRAERWLRHSNWGNYYRGEGHPSHTFPLA